MWQQGQNLFRRFPRRAQGRRGVAPARRPNILNADLLPLIEAAQMARADSISAIAASLNVQGVAASNGGRCIQTERAGSWRPRTFSNITHR
jgi:hypothetical protein